MDIQFYGTKEVNVFRVELGVLLPQTHKEYNDYNQVYGGKNAYYDENEVLFMTKEDAISYAKYKVATGVKNTYAIVVDEIINTNVEVVEEIKMSGWSFDIDMDEFTFDGTNVVFSLVKTENEQIENFLNKTILK
jgi:hypothetical protein